MFQHPHRKRGLRADPSLKGHQPAGGKHCPPDKFSQNGWGCPLLADLLLGSFRQAPPLSRGGRGGEGWGPAASLAAGVWKFQESPAGGEGGVAESEGPPQDVSL